MVIIGMISRVDLVINIGFYIIFFIDIYEQIFHMSQRLGVMRSNNRKTLHLSIAM